VIWTGLRGGRDDSLITYAHQRPGPVELFLMSVRDGVRRSLQRVPLSLLEISVARNKLVFNMVESTGNIWLARPNPHPERLLYLVGGLSPGPRRCRIQYSVVTISRHFLFAGVVKPAIERPLPRYKSQGAVDSSPRIETFGRSHNGIQSHLSSRHLHQRAGI
jgi:hypothetical protein